MTVAAPRESRKAGRGEGDYFDSLRSSCASRSMTHCQPSVSMTAPVSTQNDLSRRRSSSLGAVNMTRMRSAGLDDFPEASFLGMTGDSNTANAIGNTIADFLLACKTCLITIGCKSCNVRTPNMETR
jgi:L-rhamnose isomerase